MAAGGQDCGESAEAEAALLRRRLARSEAARAQAEALLEDKSRVLAHANEELRANKERLRVELGRRTLQLLEAQRIAGFGTMIWDAVADRGELSPHCQTLLGLSGSLEIEDSSAILERIAPEDIDGVRAWGENLLQHALAVHHAHQSAQGGGHPSPPPSLREEERMLEMRVVGSGPEKTDRDLRILAECSFDEGMGHMLLFLTVQDITREVAAAREAEILHRQDQLRMRELEELTAKLEAAREAADAANAAKTRFLAMMSHDIRTPMNGVIGMLSLFDEDGLNESQMETLALVRQSSDHLRILLDDIIDLARAEAGKLKLNPAPMNTELFMQGVLGFWGKAARDKGLGFEWERMAFGWPERTADWVMVDKFRLRQIVDNLLSNAIKYTRAGTITVRVGLVAADRMRCEVIDTGPGIPMEQHDQLFQEFSQLLTDGSQRGGAGLGLAICERLVTQMGGAIGVEEGPGGVGTCFWIELPWIAAHPGSEIGPDQPMIVRCHDGRTPRILVAEDVATNRIVAKGLLTKLGCEVAMVEDGADAVRAVQEAEYDLVLMDVSMPGMDGPTATRLIRDLPGRAGQVPVVALTAYSRPEDLAPMLNAGAMGTINKPIVLNNMFDVLHSIIGGGEEID